MRHKTHQHPIRVYYEDTDAGGIVYHSNYLCFAERARTEMIRAHGFENSTLAKQAGVLFVVRKIEIDYLKPARLDDLLTVSTTVQWMRNSSLLLRQEITHDGATLCTLDVTLVAVTIDGRPTAIPGELKDLFEIYRQDKTDL